MAAFTGHMYYCVSHCCFSLWVAFWGLQQVVTCSQVSSSAWGAVPVWQAVSQEVLSPYHLEESDFSTRISPMCEPVLKSDLEIKQLKQMEVCLLSLIRRAKYKNSAEWYQHPLPLLTISLHTQEKPCPKNISTAQQPILLVMSSQPSVAQTCNYPHHNFTPYSKSFLRNVLPLLPLEHDKVLMRTTELRQWHWGGEIWPSRAEQGQQGWAAAAASTAVLPDLEAVCHCICTVLLN